MFNRRAKHMTAVGEILRIKQLLGEQIGKQMRVLLESRHLYQRIDLGISTILKQELDPLDEQMKVSVGGEVQRALAQPWLATTTPVAPAEDLPAPIYFAIEVAKLYCGKCERLEAYRSVFIADVLRPSFGLYSHAKHPNDSTAQTFVLTLACQACGGNAVPEAFLIERRGQHLHLCGRAPMEQLPPIEGIPKDDQKLILGARIARNSGQVLGAIALLRCFLEQYARRKTQSTDYGDRLMAAYHGSLPDTFPSEFRNFVSLYSTLSAALHNANASSEVFDDTVEAVIDHFRARQLYKVK
jgi:hypothetical protein